MRVRLGVGTVGAVVGGVVGWFSYGADYPKQILPACSSGTAPGMRALCPTTATIIPADPALTIALVLIDAMIGVLVAIAAVWLFRWWRRTFHPAQPG